MIRIGQPAKAPRTAFDGQEIRQEMMRTADFWRSEPLPHSRDAPNGKGMALFPRSIGGRFAVLGRQLHELYFAGYFTGHRRQLSKYLIAKIMHLIVKFEPHPLRHCNRLFAGRSRQFTVPC